MECTTEPPPKPSNISEIVSRFSKVCRLRSVGVLSSENCDIGSNVLFKKDSSDATDEIDCEGGKVHPHPVEIQPEVNECDLKDISKLFDIISAFKLAYVQLQEAHIPYDPDKIRAANELVVAQLGELYKIKCAFKEKQLKYAKTFSAHSDVLLAEIQKHEKLLERLKFKVKVKNMEIVSLHRNLDGLDLKNQKMVEELRQKERGNIQVLDLSSFEAIFRAALRAIHEFAKPLIGLMKASGWDLDRAADSIESSVVYSKRSHKKFAFEAYISRRMFYGLPLESCDFNSIMSFNNPIDALIEDPYSTFAKFCRTKYLSVIHPTMEASFFGNLDHRTFVSSGTHPRTPFYQAFIKMARLVWVLQGIAASSEPKAKMYGVKRGSEFSDAYMESVGDLNEEIKASTEGLTRFKVEFMVLPGFRIGETLVKSRVYISTLRSSHSAC